MKFVLYRDIAGEFRWRLVASNGRILADSGEGYKNKTDCAAMIESIKQNAVDAAFVDET
ncbi:YegP family protein [Planctomyces sp. SH-PL62]|uniref:YegP family protein n=1 Tax=Planctomyces sp. SH-PL62 TaxID=1636152 RepID=UPI00078E7A4D|nr:DUF1508 domain-containing protein [Planctomyces sp. SH-PL62]AMV38097.1 hypothetical protein VT85_11710 [Planctomyces sp. SH-PL62]